MRPALPSSVAALLAALSVVVLLAQGCAGSRANQVSAPRTVEGIAPRFQPLFEALRDAVEAYEDRTARNIARNLRARIELEAAVGETPGVRDAEGLLVAFERVLEGRALVDSLTLELALREEPEGGAVHVFLRARTARHTLLELRPGAASLRLHRVTLAADGREGHSVRHYGIGNLESVALDSDGWVEVPLMSFPTAIPGNSLAARMRWSLTLLAGDVLEEGTSFPAMHVPVAALDRVDLAHFLPNTPVEPSELVSYLQRPEVALPPILERTVRILPERRAEALELLAPLVERSTPESMERMIPTLRWLSRASSPGRDPLAWKEWMRQRPVVDEDADGAGLDFSSR